MKNLKHTPAPWKLVKCNKELSNRFLIIGADRNTVCRIKTCDEDGNNQEADAKLIASAPELLEQLEIALKALQEYEGKWEQTGNDRQYQMFKAIKKATK